MPFESGDPGVLRQAKGQQKRGKGARLARRGAAVKGEGRCPPGSVRQKSKGGQVPQGGCRQRGRAPPARQRAAKKQGGQVPQGGCRQRGRALPARQRAAKKQGGASAAGAFAWQTKRGKWQGLRGPRGQPPEKAARAAPGALPPRGPGALQPEAGACVRLRLNTIGIALTGCAQRRRSAGTAWDARRRCPPRATPSSSARTSRRAPPPPPP